MTEGGPTSEPSGQGRTGGPSRPGPISEPSGQGRASETSGRGPTDERPEPDALVLLARAAAERAYAPYSRFRVGAAAEVDGQVYPGCNVENASYGLTVCAERIALFGAVAAGHRRVPRLAVSCVDAGSELGANGRMPCGACRQVMAELMGLDGEVLVDGVRAYRVSELLPDAFTL